MRVESDLEARVDVEVRLGDINYSAIQNSISFLYRQSGIDRSVELKCGISLYCAVSNRKSRQLKQDLGPVISEGQKPMSQEVYSFVAKKLLTTKKKEHIFSRLFMILNW